jgi:hypothetical protein
MKTHNLLILAILMHKLWNSATLSQIHGYSTCKWSFQSENSWVTYIHEVFTYEMLLIILSFIFYAYKSIKTCFFLSLWGFVHKFTESFRNVIPQHRLLIFDDVLEILLMIMFYENAFISWPTLQTFQKVTLIMTQSNKFTEFSLDVNK